MTSWRSEWRVHRVLACSSFAFVLALGCREAARAGFPTKSIVEAATAGSAAVYIDGGPVAFGTALLLPEGSAVSCLHVAKLSRSRIELLIGGKRVPATIVRGQPSTDLVLLSVSEARGKLAGVRAPKWAVRASLQAGEPLVLVGAPFGLHASVLLGAVAHTDRRRTDPDFPHIPFIQTQGLSYPGTSGGAVYRMDGRVIGLNRATYGLAPGTGIGLTLPAETVQAFLDEVGGR